MPIPKCASFEEKYEIAYAKFIWMAKSNFSFIRRQLGEGDIEQFKRADVEALKEKRWSRLVSIKCPEGTLRSNLSLRSTQYRVI